MVAIGSTTLGVYNPIFYANEALIHLEKALGMASRVHRGFDSERQAFGKGDTINIRRPDTFSVQTGGTAASAGVATETVAISLDQWKEVKFALTDKELAFSGDRLISDHIAPAAYALADNIDQALVALHLDAGNAAVWGGSNPITDITTARKAMFDAAVPMDAGSMHMMLSGEMERQALANSAFSQWQGAGDAGVSTQLRGSLGTKFGFECFSNQNALGEASGDQTYFAYGNNDDYAAQTTAAYAKGVSSIAIDGAGNSKVWADNSPVKIRMTNGQDHYTTLSAAVTTHASAGTATLSLNDPLRHAVADDAAVVYLGTGNSKNVETGLAFHKNAFALAMAPLPEIGNELGAKVATVSDPVTGLSLRSRVYYVGDSSQVHVALDVLYGVKTLDAAMACRLERDLA